MLFLIALKVYYHFQLIKLHFAVILKVAFVGELSQTAAATTFLSMTVITQFADQVKVKGNSQLTHGIFKLF